MARRVARALGSLVVFASLAAAPAPPPKKLVHEASGIELVLIPAAKPFYAGVTEVTTGQFRRFVEATGYKTDAERGVDDGNGNGVGTFTALPEGEREWSKETTWRRAFDRFADFKLADDHPAMHVSWNDAQAFAKHYGLRLLTEEEWEFAARAGVKTKYPWGGEPKGGAAWGNVRDQAAARIYGQTEVCFPFDDGNVIVAKVRSYKPNAWGLYDVIGNVAEWVDAPSKQWKVLRGGAWNDYPDGATLSDSAGMTAPARRDFIGFRVGSDTMAKP